MSKDKGYCTAFLEVCNLAEALGVQNIEALPGCWEYSWDDYKIVVNGKKENRTPSFSSDMEIPPYHCFIVKNDMPVGLIYPEGGSLMQRDDCNEDIFIDAVVAETKRVKQTPKVNTQMKSAFEAYDKIKDICKRTTGIDLQKTGTWQHQLKDGIWRIAYNNTDLPLASDYCQTKIDPDHCLVQFNTHTVGYFTKDHGYFLKALDCSEKIFCNALDKEIRHLKKAGMEA